MVNHFGLIVLWGAGIYHLIMGLLSMSSVRLVRRAVGTLYGVSYPETIDPGLEFIWKPLGAFAIVLSLFCFRAAWVGGPSDQRFTLIVVCALLATRAGIRWFHSDLLRRAHAVSPGRNAVNIAFNLALAASGLLVGMS